MTLPGCISPRDLIPEPVSPAEQSPVPTTPPQSERERVVTVPDSESFLAASAPRHFVATPYGYVLTRPVPGIRISIIEIKEETDATGQKYLTGRIKNEEQEKIDHITLQFNLYSANGYLIGNTYASVNGLAPQKTWKFSTQPFPPKEYHHYELAEIFTA